LRNFEQASGGVGQNITNFLKNITANLKKITSNLKRETVSWVIRNRLLGNKKPSLGCETVSRGPFATVQMAISNRPNEKMNRAKRKKAGVGTPAFAPKII
jgi:hypothetical protein